MLTCIVAIKQMWLLFGSLPLITTSSEGRSLFWLAQNAHNCHIMLQKCFNPHLTKGRLRPAHFPSGFKSYSQWIAVIIIINLINNWLRNNNWANNMWAKAQHDGRPAEYRWRPLLNAAKFGWRPLLVLCSNAAKTRNPLKLPGVPKLTKRSQPLVGRSSPYCGDM